jgi:hypothetical protein
MAKEWQENAASFIAVNRAENRHFSRNPPERESSRVLARLISDDQRGLAVESGPGSRRGPLICADLR